MSKNSNRKFSSWNYFLQKTITKLATYRPSPIFIAILAMAAAIFLLGGGVYDVLMNPVAAIPLGSGRFLAFIPYQIHDQLLIGSIAIMILYALGATGFLLIYRGTRRVHNPRQVSFFIGIGVALVLIAYIAIEIELYWILHYTS
ncbi:MAG: hypothetical protein QXI71_01440 [Candidatus Bathyarchaeia archaeon]|nr:hypothetical protein [Candidatus Bathyarchaeota archaeon]